MKGKVLETALMTAREVSDQLCEALHAEGIQCVGNKFVVWRRSETLARKTGTAKAKFKINPVKAGAQKRRAAAKAAKDWAASDRIRDSLKKLGIIVKDTKDGAEWTLE